MAHPPKEMTIRTRLIWIASLIALLAALVVASAGLGYRFELWGLGTAFGILRVGTFAAIAGLVLALAALIAALVRPPRILAAVPAVALVATAIALYPTFEMRRMAQGTPPINDITTDPTDPPPYDAIAGLRGRGDQAVQYPGEQFATQQRDAYPDIQPVITDLAPDQAYRQALAAAQASGWAIVGEDAEQGRIEAVDRTLWFGFKDDIVVRVRAEGERSRIDVRSSSRVGRSDLGTNARRIRTFLKQLEAEPAG